MKYSNMAISNWCIYDIQAKIQSYIFYLFLLKKTIFNLLMHGLMKCLIILLVDLGCKTVSVSSILINTVLP